MSVKTGAGGTANRPDLLDFQFSLDATSLTRDTWVDVNSLAFASIESSLGPRMGTARLSAKHIGGVVPQPWQTGQRFISVG